MNFKTTGMLLGLLIVVGMVWLLFPRGADSTDGKSPTGEPPLLPGVAEETPLLDAAPRDEDIVRVELERPGQPRLVFERPVTGEDPRASDDWQIVEPLAAPAETFKVSGLIRTLTGLQSHRRFEPGANGAPTAAEAGVEPPVATVTLVDSTGGRTSVQIGQRAVLSSDTYVRLANRATIHVVARDLRPQIQDRPQDYRAKRVLRFRPDEVVRVRVEHGGRTHDFSRSGEEWIINEPTRAYADGAKVRSRLLSPLSLLQAADFVDDTPSALSPYGLDEPFLTATLTTEHKRPAPVPSDAAETQPTEAVIETRTHVIRIGGFADLKNERRYAQAAVGGERPPPVTDPSVAGAAVVAVAAADVTGLIPNLDELRDPRITRLKAADLTEIGLTIAETTTTLRKVDDRWRGADDAAELDGDAVLDLVSAIEELSAISAIDGPEAPAAYGLDPPRATLAIGAVGRVTPLVLHIGGPTASGRNAYVQRTDQPAVLVVSEAQAARLAIDPLALRSREVFSFAPERLQRLRVEREGDVLVIERVPAEPPLATVAEDDWTLREPTDTPLALPAARIMAQNLARLRARNVVARGEAARYGLEPPTVVIRFDVAQLPAATAEEEAPTDPPLLTHTLRLGSVAGVAYARRDDDPHIFELDESVYRALTAELIEPQLFTFESDAVVRIQVNRPAGPLELARRDERWVYVPDPFVALDQKAVQDFVQDLAQLRVEAWLAYREGDLAAVGLVSSPVSIVLELSDGREIVMTLESDWSGDSPCRAGLPAERRLFRLRQSDCEKVLRGLDDYLAPALR